MPLFSLIRFIAHYFVREATVVKPDYIVLIILYLFSLTKYLRVINFPQYLASANGRWKGQIP